MRLLLLLPLLCLASLQGNCQSQQDSTLIEKYKDEAIGFEKRDGLGRWDMCLCLRWDGLKDTAVKEFREKIRTSQAEKFEALKKKERKEICDVTEAQAWLSSVLTFGKHSCCNYSLRGVRYKEVEEGFLIQGELNENTDIVYPECERYYSTETYLVCRNYNVVLIEKSVARNVCLPPLPYIQVATTEIVYAIGDSILPKGCSNLPQFEGGYAALAQFFQSNISYPQDAIEYNISGNMYVSFEVTELGELSNVRIARSFHTADNSVEKETLRVAKLSAARWSPPLTKGNPNVVTVTIPIKFRLEERPMFRERLL